MKAVIQKDFGGPEVLEIGEIDTPGLADAHVLIRVVASSVNRPDIMQREGKYPPPPGESEVLGLDVAGVVEEVGAAVTRWRPGDRVMALVAGGGYAEYARAEAGHVIAIPERMSFEEAACVCETYLTAFLNIFLLGGLEDAETILLHGGGGGVNTAGIQLCRALRPRATVFVTASSGKVQRVRELGAHEVVDYQSQDFAQACKALTDGRGVDVILDHIGGPYLAQNMKTLATGGRLVEIGVMGGVKAELNLALMMVKRQQIIGSVLRSRPVAEKARIIERFTEEAMPLFADGTLTPLVDRVFPLEQVAEAHRTMEGSQHFGKIVLSVS